MKRTPMSATKITRFMAAALSLIISAGVPQAAFAASPSVSINQALGQADPTMTSPINFSVVFSEAASGFTTGDVSLSGTAGATSAVVTEVAPNDGTTYAVAVSGMTTSGTVVATIPANVASDGSGNPNTASTTIDNTVTFVTDTTGPGVSINQALGQADPTMTSPINFSVVFSEAASGFTTGDVSLSGTAGATSAVVTEVAPNDGTTYAVAVSGMTTSGTVVATIPANVASDGSGNPNTASTTIDNTVTFVTDTTGPGVSINQALGQADPTMTSPINFSVVFSEAASGFTTGDVSLSGTAGATSAVVTEVAPNDGTTYAVAVSGMTTSGTVVATIPANVASDGSGNPNTASTTIDNTVTFVTDTTGPGVSINQALGQADPTMTSPINFSVVFSEAASGFTTGDVSLSGTAGATSAVVTEVAPNDGTTYAVAVSGMTTSGTVVATIPANVASDGSGNPNTASTTIDNTVTFVANSAPAATITNGQCASGNTASGTIDVTLSDPDSDALVLTLASNSDPTIVPDANILIGGSGNNRVIGVLAAAKKQGTTVLTFNLSDGKTTVPVMVTVRVGSDKNETLNGTTGVDMIFGRGGKNTINGNAGNDLLCGGNSVDTINGGDGNDVLEGQNGNDELSGGRDNDILRGNSGNDGLTGGTGADSFSGGANTDTATDFDAGQGDTHDGTVEVGI